jgi:transcriptional regulator with XRE-family HTH domain
MNGTRYFTIRLRELMEKNGLKVGQLAMVANVAPATASLWVNGLEMPPDDIQCILAIWLDVDRCEIWQFKKECFAEIVELAKLHKKQTEIEKRLSKKLNGGEDAAGDL